MTVMIQTQMAIVMQQGFQRAVARGVNTNKVSRRILTNIAAGVGSKPMRQVWNLSKNNKKQQPAVSAV